MSRKNSREARKSLGLPDLEVMRDQMAYEAIIKEEYERAKACYLARKRPDNAGVPTLEPWDMQGMPET
jgi:hypothetical protein